MLRETGKVESMYDLGGSARGDKRYKITVKLDEPGGSVDTRFLSIPITANQARIFTVGAKVRINVEFQS